MYNSESEKFSVRMINKPIVPTIQLEVPGILYVIIPYYQSIDIRP